MPRKKIATSALVVAAAAVTLNAPAAAATQENSSSEDFTTTVTAFGAEDIREAEQSQAAISSSDSEVAEFAQQHVESEARSGRNVSIDDVQVSVLNDTRQGRLLVAWDGNSSPDRIAISEATSQDERGSTAIGVRWPGVEGGASSSDAPSGVGYDSAINVDGFVEVATDQCATIRFSPHYEAASDHLLRTCYEKFHREGSTDWVYNRYSSFLPAEPDSTGVRAQIADFTIRSIPWEGEEDRVVRIGEHTRGNNDPDCQAGNFTFTLGPASLQVPVRSCDGMESLPNDNHNSMGMEWTGRSDTQKFVDAAVAIETSAPDVEPVYADYDWTEIITCGWIPGVNCSSSLPEFQHDYLIHTDTGWHWPGK